MGKLKSIVGDNIRKLRRERGWTQAFVAESLGVTAPFLTMIESGQRGMSIDLMFPRQFFLQMKNRKNQKKKTKNLKI